VHQGLVKRFADICGIPLCLPAIWGHLRYAAASRRFKRFDKDKFVNDNVYCVGSGPSLDDFDLSAIQNSTIILLNSAIDVWDEIPSSNNILWLCQDVSAFHKNADRVPKHITRLVTVHQFERAYRVIRKLDPCRDNFILPKPTFRRKYPFRDGPTAGRLHFRPSYAWRNGKPLLLHSIDDGFIYPATTMLLAIAESLLLARRSIHVLGFDMGVGPQGASNNYSKKTINLSTVGPDQFPCETIEIFLAEFVRAARLKGVKIYNYSPYAPERILIRKVAHDAVGGLELP